MTSAQEFYKRDQSKPFINRRFNMNAWSLGMWLLAMEFAEAYADLRELEVRKELSNPGEK